jgi:2-methylcitrate dehydratase PrpD
VAGLGTDWAVERTSLKPWPFCRYSHGALDAFANLVDTHGLKPDDIDSVTVTVPPFSFIQMIATSTEVTDKLKIMTSLPYALAMVANRIPPGPKWWADDVFEDPAVHAFAQRVHAQVDEGLNEPFLAELKAGRQLSASTVPGQIRVTAPTEQFEATIERGAGDPADPAKVLGDDALRAKVVEFAAGVLAPGAGAAIVDAAFALDRAANLDALMGPCAEPAR